MLWGDASTQIEEKLVLTTGFRPVGKEWFCFAPLSVFSDAHDPFEQARRGRLGLPDNYQWTLSTTANQSYAGGTTTGWSNATGSGSASGNAVSSGGGTWNSQSLSSAGNSVTSTTSCGCDSTNQADSCNATANWTEDAGRFTPAGSTGQYQLSVSDNEKYTVTETDSENDNYADGAGTTETETWNSREGTPGRGHNT